MSKEVNCSSNVSQTGDWLRSPQPPEAIWSGSEALSRWAIFHNFLKKKLFSHHWITFRTYSKQFESTRFLAIESQLKKLSSSVLVLFVISVQNTFKILHFGVKFCDLVQVGGSKVNYFCNILAVKNNPLKDFR